MKTASPRCWCALGGLLLLASSCIELVGQRITLRYDVERDRLLCLLHYDGIHNSVRHPDYQRDAEQKLVEFVRDRDVMLFDWFGHLRRDKLTKAAGSQATPPKEGALLRALLDNSRVHVLGRYRDPAGHAGAAQLVVIEHASAAIRAANAAIDEAVLAAAAGSGGDGDEWPATRALWRERAQAGGNWLALDGNAVVFRAPVDAGEWASAKLAFLRELKQFDAKDDVFLRLLAVAPLSLEQRAGEVALRLGDPASPTPLRVRWPRPYQPNVEAVLAAEVPNDLDAALAAHLLRGERPAEPLAEPLGELVAWGPAEDQVRAVLGAARTGSEADRERAAAWLDAFAERWNQRRAFPAAPRPSGGPEVDASAWEAWYLEVVTHPEVQGAVAGAGDSDRPAAAQPAQRPGRERAGR